LEKFKKYSTLPKNSRPTVGDFEERFENNEMKKIFVSLAIIGAVSAAVIGATRSFFSNTETSTGNTFTAGGIDLKVGNLSYYNGIASASSSWLAKDLAAGDLFFNFANLQPGDIGEDLIDLSVQNNSAYACLDIDITGTPENGQTDAEKLVDGTAGANEGELQNELHFSFWADNGDNVLATDEVGKIFVDNKTLADIASGQGKIVLADSTKNIWNAAMAAGSMSSNQTYHIGKAFCYGTLTQAPAAPGINDPTKVSGFICNGEPVNNASQTDGVLGTVSFTAVQAKNNGSFRCNVAGMATPTPTTTPVAILSDDFGTIASDSNDILNWEETGDDSAGNNTNGTIAKKFTSGSNSASPDGGRFALIAGGDWICSPVNATGYNTLVLNYYWRGDSDALDGENGVVEYFTGGTCDLPNGLTTLTTHELKTGASAWSALQSLNLPAALNNTPFFIRFRSDTFSLAKSFRIDGVSVTGIPN